jgi:hypothetical protein
MNGTWHAPHPRAVHTSSPRSDTLEMRDRRHALDRCEGRGLRLSGSIDGAQEGQDRLLIGHGHLKRWHLARSVLEDGSEFGVRSRLRDSVCQVGSQESTESVDLMARLAVVATPYRQTTALEIRQRRVWRTTRKVCVRHHGEPDICQHQSGEK